MTIREVIKMSKRVLLQNWEHQPILILDDGKHSQVVVLVNFPNFADEKQGYMASLGLTAAKNPKVGELVQVFIVFEGRIGSPLDGHVPVPPNTDPKRQEGLILANYVVATGETAMHVLMIERAAGRKIRRLNPLKAAKDASVESPLIESFLAGYRFGRLGQGH